MQIILNILFLCINNVIILIKFIFKEGKMKNILLRFVNKKAHSINNKKLLFAAVLSSIAINCNATQQVINNKMPLKPVIQQLYSKSDTKNPGVNYEKMYKVAWGEYFEDQKSGAYKNTIYTGGIRTEYGRYKNEKALIDLYYSKYIKLMEEGFSRDNRIKLNVGLMTLKKMSNSQAADFVDILLLEENLKQTIISMRVEAYEKLSDEEKEELNYLKNKGLIKDIERVFRTARTNHMLKNNNAGNEYTLMVPREANAMRLMFNMAGQSEAEREAAKKNGTPMSVYTITKMKIPETVGLVQVDLLSRFPELVSVSFESANVIFEETFPEDLNRRLKIYVNADTEDKFDDFVARLTDAKLPDYVEIEGYIKETGKKIVTASAYAIQEN